MFWRRFTLCCFSAANPNTFVQTTVRSSPLQPYKQWLKRVGIDPIHIYPGSPWENGYNERFNGTLRREVLNTEWFTSIRQAQIVINQWLHQYNHIRPHHALGMRAPVPETLIEKSQLTGPAQGG